MKNQDPDIRKWREMSGGELVVTNLEQAPKELMRRLIEERSTDRRLTIILIILTIVILLLTAVMVFPVIRGIFNF